MSKFAEVLARINAGSTARAMFPVFPNVPTGISTPGTLQPAPRLIVPHVPHVPGEKHKEVAQWVTLPDRIVPDRTATSDEAAELRRLCVAVYFADGAATVAYAIELALSDVDAALIYYRDAIDRHALPASPAPDAPATPPRVRCGDCAQFRPWPDNPTAALGTCGAGREPGRHEPNLWPDAERDCPLYQCKGVVLPHR